MARLLEDPFRLSECPPLLDELVRPPPGRHATHPAIAPFAGDALTACFLGDFHISFNDQSIDRLPTGHSGSLLKYMIYFHQRCFPREVLIEDFWPGAQPDMARNRLNVAISGIRHALRQKIDPELIVFEDGKYHLSPELHIWLDVEEFEAHLENARLAEQSGQLAAAVAYQETASNLYQGDFLQGDLYEEWTTSIRERLRLIFLDNLFRLSCHYFESRQFTACAGMCQAILARDNCREDVHCLLMRCYAGQNQFALAIRQYQRCVAALRSELDVPPSAATQSLYQKLRRRQPFETTDLT